MIRVVIADDHPVVRDGLRALLSSLADIEVVATAANGAEAVREALLHRPDVLVMDMAMPGLDGVAATQRLSAAAPDVAVLILTMFEEDQSLLAAMRAGARGYLLKGAEQEEIERAVRGVAAGAAVFGPGIAAKLLGHVASATESTAAPFPELTSREREVLDAIASGLTNSAIAARFGLSGKTIGNHNSSIFAKLGFADRTQAVIRAREAGLGRPSGPSSDGFS